MAVGTGFAGLEARGKVVHGDATNAIILDFSTLPVFEVRYIGTVDDTTFQRYLDDLVSVLSARKPYVLLADATRSGAPSARQRQLQAEVIRVHEAGFARYCRGAAFVIDSALIRGALTAILWLQKLPYEHAIVPTRGEALTWLRGRLTSH